MDYWVEVRAWQNRVGPPFFVKLADLPHTSYLGFRSVYAYPPDVKEHIAATGSTAGLGEAAVYSETLFLDFDNCDPGELLVWLYDEGYAHSVWHSGNRSVHVHVPCEPMFGAWVPWSQRVWVTRNAPLADVSFYTQAGQYRLPGTRHEQTGRRKLLRHELYGRRLVVPRTDKPSVEAAPPGEHTPGDFFAHLLRTKGEGERRVFAWHLAMLAKTEGVAIDQAVGHILWWNERHCKPPLPVDVVRARVLAVYSS